MGWLSFRTPVATWPREVPEFTRIAATSDGGSPTAPLPNRHSSPNLAAQLEAARAGGIDTVVCSVLDGDERLRLCAAVAAQHADLVARGIARLVELTGAKRVWMVVDESAPPPWIAPLRDAARACGAAIVELPNQYPQADPTMLIYCLTDRRLPPGALPTQQRVLLVDAPGAAAFAGADAVWLGVLDHTFGPPRYLAATPGMTVAAALRAANAPTEGRTVRCGDLLRDLPLPPGQLVGEGELIVHLLPRTPAPAASPCIRCGWCAQVCPTRVSPAWILEAAQLGDERMARTGGRDACIECGLCNEVCPAHLPLLAAIRQIKQPSAPSAPVRKT